MFVPNLPCHEALFARSRLRAQSAAMDQMRFWELAWLMAMGIVAASAAVFWDWSLGIPGHAILRIVFPMVLGVAVVPRHGSGAAMGTAALAAVLIFTACGWGAPGAGAMTSLAVFGPILDAVLWRARRGWLLFSGFAVAGLGSNLIAFTIRAATRLGSGGHSTGGLGRGGGMGGGHGMGAGRRAVDAAGSWWTVAPLSYLACGLIAGLICAVLWFSIRPRRANSPHVSQP